MLKAIGYEVDYEFFIKKDGSRSFMNIKGGFKTYADAERWAHENTIDGEVVAIYPADEDF